MGVRTIEERLTEILETLDSTPVPVPSTIVKTYGLVDILLEDFRAEGIAGREISERSDR